MFINDTEIEPGETKRINVNISRLPSRSPIDIAITVSRSMKPGPTVLLMGGLHGDEINGIEIVRRIIENEYNVPTAGTVICIPIINIYGFIHTSRYVPDGKDVNRSFPGSKNGSLASRVAYYLMHDILPKLDFGIDFHTGGDDRTNFPQVRCMMDDPVNQELARAFHAPFTINAPYRPKSLRQAAAKMGKHILVYEGGESSRFDEFAIREGVNGTMRFLGHLGMTAHELEIPTLKNQVIAHSSWIRTKASGLFQSAVTSGQKVSKNQVLGHITDPFGEFKVPIKAPYGGFVIGLNNDPILHLGDAVVHLGAVK